MEPVVIIVKEIKNGKILLTEDELKTIVQRAYNDGYWEGRKNSWYCGGITYTNTTPTYITTCSNTPEKYKDITITCDTAKNNVNGQINLFDNYINDLIGDFMND